VLSWIFKPVQIPFMESPVNGVDSLPEIQNSVSEVNQVNHDPLSSGSPLPSRPPLRASRTCDGGHQTKIIHHQNSHVINQKHSHEEGNNLNKEGLPAKLSTKKPPLDDSKGCESNGVLVVSESERKGTVDNHNHNHAKSHSQPVATFCPSPQNSFYAATVYSEAKGSFTNTELSECASVDKSCESEEVANSSDFNESRKTSICRASTGSDASDESSTSSLSSVLYKPHKANDIRWEAIQAVRIRDGVLEMRHFRLLKKLGCGDIGSVYLAELSGTRTSFAMKVMNKTELANRKKLLRAQTEREILQSLDHPFLPTLYTHFETETFSCLVMEFCPGGDLHALRQRQPGKYFSEHAVRLAIPFQFDSCNCIIYNRKRHVQQVRIKCT